MGTAEKVLSTASRLFCANGVRAVGIEWIVAESGVSKTSLYRHFRTKEELVAAFLERADREFWQQWDGVVAAAANPQAELMSLLDWIGKRVSRDGYRGCPTVKNQCRPHSPERRRGPASACVNGYETLHLRSERCSAHARRKQ
jgi:AcrR family transcriptional regulator